MATFIRNHWQIENSLHWVMDVTFRQDECRIRTGNAAANFATIKLAAVTCCAAMQPKSASHRNGTQLLGTNTICTKLLLSDIQSISLVTGRGV